MRRTCTIALAGLLVAATAHAHDRSSRSTAAPKSGPAKADQAEKIETKGTDAKSLPAGSEAFLANDKMFLWRVHWINHNEVQAGDLARTKGTIAGLKDFATMLMADHRKAESRLIELAKKKDIGLELTKDEYAKVRSDLAKHMQALMDLEHEDRKDFDRAFLKHMIHGHEEAIQLLTAYRAKTKDGDLRAFIDGVLPDIRKHHERATALLEKAEVDRQDVRGDERKTPSGKAKTPVTPEEGTERQEDIEEGLEEGVRPPPDSEERIPVPRP